MPQLIQKELDSFSDSYRLYTLFASDGNFSWSWWFYIIILFIAKTSALELEWTEQ